MSAAARGSAPELDATLRATLARAGVRDAQWEASVRGGEGTVSGLRMMIERASVEHARGVWDALQLPWSSEVERLAQAAASAGVPLITGWDLAGPAPIAKLYANASDEAEPHRARIVRDVGWPGPAWRRDAPHVLALNASARGLERKAYSQRAASASSRDDTPSASAAWLDALVRAADAKAGQVTSWDLAPGDEVRERAFFVAVRGDDARKADPLLAQLPGWRDADVARALPFPRGQCRSIGVDLRGAAPLWTAYFKPAGHGQPLHTLEPVARFAWGDRAIGVFVEPTELTPRAYARTSRSAISFRGASDVPREIVEPLMRWVVERVRAGETQGLDAAAVLGGEPPPAPWARSSPAP